MPHRRGPCSGLSAAIQIVDITLRVMERLAPREGVRQKTGHTLQGWKMASWRPSLSGIGVTLGGMTPAWRPDTISESKSAGKQISVPLASLEDQRLDGCFVVHDTAARGVTCSNRHVSISFEDSASKDSEHRRN